MIKNDQNIFMLKDNEKGISMVLALLIVVSILAISLVVSLIITTKIKITKDLKYSVKAFYMADSGMEKAISVDKGDTGGSAVVCDVPGLPNDQCKVKVKTIGTTKLMKTTGTLNNINRSVETVNPIECKQVLGSINKPTSDDISEGKIGCYDADSNGECDPSSGDTVLTNDNLFGSFKNGTGIINVDIGKIAMNTDDSKVIDWDVDEIYIRGVIDSAAKIKILANKIDLQGATLISDNNGMGINIRVKYNASDNGLVIGDKSTLLYSTAGNMSIVDTNSGNYLFNLKSSCLVVNNWLRIKLNSSGSNGDIDLIGSTVDSSNNSIEIKSNGQIHINGSDIGLADGTDSITIEGNSNVTIDGLSAKAASLIDIKSENGDVIGYGVQCLSGSINISAPNGDVFIFDPPVGSIPPC